MRIWVTGLGVLSAVGRGVEATTTALLEGRSGLGALRRFASPRHGHLPVAEVEGIPDAPGATRTLELGRRALEDAVAEARLASIPDAARERMALVVGACVGGMPESEQAIGELLTSGRTDPAVFLRHECGYTTAMLARDFDLGGPALTISNACSSGAQAIATGAELLRADAADVVVAGGVDAICRLTLNGFAGLLAIDPEGARPFDRDRRGMSLGEGAAFLVLEREERARARGAVPVAVLAGWSSTCDAHHATAPDPEGRGAASAIRLALDEAALDPASVSYVNAHGTGTVENDRAEARALRSVFGAAVPPFSSTKRIFGHALAAAGAIEAVVAVLAVQRDLVPGTPGFATADPQCGLEPVRLAYRAPVEVAVSASYGFGGTNCVVCFTKAPAP